MLSTVCEETVSLLEALVLGAGEACIEISPTSILTVAIALIAVVPLTKLALYAAGIGVRKSFDKVRNADTPEEPRQPAFHVDAPEVSEPPKTTSGKPAQTRPSDGGPIRSTGAWGHKR